MDCDVYMNATNRERRHARKSLMFKANSTLGICENFRLIYDLVERIEDGELKDKITRRLIDGVIMAKNMSNRLDLYRKKYNDRSGGGYKNLVGLTDVIKRKEYRNRRSL